MSSAPLPRVVLGLGLLALAAWEGTLTRDSASSRASVGIAIGAVVAATVVAGRGRQGATSKGWLLRMLGALRGGFSKHPGDLGRSLRVATTGWGVLIAATIGWDLASFERQKAWLPTLSRLFGDVTGRPVGRSLVFLAWLALGLYLALGRRAPTGSRPAPGPDPTPSGARRRDDRGPNP